MGAMQNFTVSFGLIKFQAGLWKGSEARGSAVSCKRLHKHITKDGEQEVVSLHQTGQKNYCKSCDQDLSSADIVSGYEFEKGKFIEITDADKDSLKTENTGSIQIDQIIPRKFLFDRPEMLDGFYYLTPQLNDRTPPDAYVTMLEALGDRVAIGHCEMYSRTRPLAIMKGKNGVFHVFTLMYQGEIRNAAPQELPAVNKTYVKMAKQILDAMEAEEPVIDYPDDYKLGWDAMIADKLKGVKKEDKPEAPPTLKVSSVEDMFKSALADLEVCKKKTKTRRKSA